MSAMTDAFRAALAAEIAEAEAEAYRLAERDGIPREVIKRVLRQLAMTAEELEPNVGPRCSFCGAGQLTPPITLVNRPGWPSGTMICIECRDENYPNERPSEPSRT